MKIKAGTGVVECGFEHGSTRRCITQSTNPIPLGQWVNISWVRTGHRVIDQEIYIDSILEVNVNVADELVHANQITIDECTNDTGFPIDSGGSSLPTYGQGFYKNQGQVWINTISSCGYPEFNHFDNLDINWYLKRIIWYNKRLFLNDIVRIYNQGLNGSIPREDLVVDYKMNKKDNILICDFSENNINGNLYDNSIKYLGDANNCGVILQDSWGFDPLTIQEGGGTWNLI